jgi:hypothetical protein
MSRRFPDGHVPTPQSPKHRYDLLIDATSDLDEVALWELVVLHHAGIEDLLAAAAQTDRSAVEVGRTLLARYRTNAAAGMTKRERRRLVDITTTLTQPAIPGLELS